MGWRFKLFGIPVRVHPFFLLIGLVLSQQARPPAGMDSLAAIAIWLAVVFTGVLAHELGHALVGRSFGLTPNIELHGMGGLTWWSRGREVSALKSILISVAGPAVGIAIGAAALAYANVVPVDGVSGFFLEIVVWVNLGWGVLNLIPILPLDGGNIMASVLEVIAKDRGRKLARYGSMFLSAGLAALVLALSGGKSWWTIGILALFAFQNYRALKQEQELAKDLPVREDLREAHAALERRDGAAAIAAAGRVAEKAQTPRMKIEAQRLLAWGQLMSGDPEAAHRTATAIANDADPLLLGLVAYENGQPEAALPHLEAALEQGSSPLLEDALVRSIRETGRFDRAHAILEGGGADRLRAQAVYQLEEAAYEAGRYDDAARIGMILFERERDPIRAFNVACALTRAGDANGGIEWLGRAAEAGFRDLSLLDSDDDLEPLRGSEEFAELRRRVAAG